MDSCGEPGQTLAEQARLLAPDSYRNGVAPGHTPNLARYWSPCDPLRRCLTKRETEHNRRSSDAALQNLEFIGSSATEKVIGPAPLSPDWKSATSQAPAPSLREAPMQDVRIPDPTVKSDPARLPDLEPRAPLFLPPDNKPSVKTPPQRLESTHDSELFKFSAHSVIDMDSAPVPSWLLQRNGAAVATGDRPGLLDAGLPSMLIRLQVQANPEENSPVAATFSSSLITSEDIRRLIG